MKRSSSHRLSPNVAGSGWPISWMKNQRYPWFSTYPCVAGLVGRAACGAIELNRRTETAGQRHQLIDVAGLGVEPDHRGHALRGRQLLIDQHALRHVRRSRSSRDLGLESGRPRSRRPGPSEAEYQTRRTCRCVTGSHGRPLATSRLSPAATPRASRPARQTSWPVPACCRPPSRSGPRERRCSCRRRRDRESACPWPTAPGPCR